MTNYITMFKELDPGKKRMFFFFLAVILFSLSLLLMDKEMGNGGTLSSFIRLMGTFSLFYVFTYKTKERELKIHSWIRQKTQYPPEKVFLLLSVVFTMITGILAFLFFKELPRGPLTPKLYIFSLFSGVVLLFTSSLWERWSFLRKETNTSRI